ncbi:unnamed protein product [Didymodactylos carnosus]|uniref:EF-hand domain-containing protein n=1 Tax=Didymodactylos carnosus TaxID=1234261 RepID=A0A814MZ37_9BILA|nr:unnamed protein product [Didymodactylos carnosus]CAF3850792.1 unnamed protein product [Didymodactylos carnosus]
MYHTRVFRVSVIREKYGELVQMAKMQSLAFSNFLLVLRPFIIGTYLSDEIGQGFELLDTDKSDTIDVEELTAFLPVINPYLTAVMLLRYFSHIDENFDYKLNLNVLL